MTLEETRQLGIEFERRVLTMIPEAELTAKLDTETIYSYLNQYQDKFVHDIYKSMDQIPSPSKPSAYIETMLQGLLKEYREDVNKSGNLQYTISLPNDFGLYLNSVTHVADSYNYKDTKEHEGYIPNNLISQSQVHEFLSRPQDSMRIMRQPIASLNNDRTITVLYDKYTTPDEFVMKYYKIPKYMNILTSNPCELPMDIFDNLVTGAVDLYVQYVAGAEARKRQQLEAQQHRNKLEDEQ